MGTSRRTVTKKSTNPYLVLTTFLITWNTFKSMINNVTKLPHVPVKTPNLEKVRLIFSNSFLHSNRNNVKRFLSWNKNHLYRLNHQDEFHRVQHWIVRQSFIVSSHEATGEFANFKVESEKWHSQKIDNKRERKVRKKENLCEWWSNFTRFACLQHFTFLFNVSIMSI